MTSLAGAVQAVGSEELLDSLRVNGAHGLGVDRGAHSGLSSSLAGGRRLDASEPPLQEAIAIPAVSAGYLFAKRVLDIVGSLLGLVLLSPLILFVAVLINLSDGGSVFYPHTRVGRWGREFRCLKFRTMVINADVIKGDMAHLNTHDDHRTFKVPDDPRVTLVGRWMRRGSLDEIPQLWNVLLGHMSLVGPRPPVPKEVEHYSLDDMQRLMVKPGLTCIWQVSGRSRLPFRKQLEMDLAYIQRRNFWLDLKLILKTLPAVFSRDGAY